MTVDLPESAPRPGLPERNVPIDVLAVVFVGGALGGLARYGLANALPVAAGTFPTATWLTNVVGCALIGVLMTLLLAHGNPHRLIRPFVGVGVLGGFTTFSTFAVETDKLFQTGASGTALLYVAASLIGGLVAVWLAVLITRRLVHEPHEPIESVSEWS